MIALVHVSQLNHQKTY